MQFLTARILTPHIFAASGLARKHKATAAYDPAYDEANRSILTLAYSNGVSGLTTKGYEALTSLPNSPRAGAASAVTEWYPPNCGNYYLVTGPGPHLTQLLPLLHQDQQILTE
jgi:hypothetical protein